MSSSTKNFNVIQEQSGICRRLRTKTSFGSFIGSATFWEDGESTTAVYWCLIRRPPRRSQDRKSTRLNSSHPSISYAVFCLKKKILLHAIAGVPWLILHFFFIYSV